MASEEREKMNELIHRIQTERDSQKFIELIEQLNELLGSKETKHKAYLGWPAQQPSALPEE